MTQIENDNVRSTAIELIKGLPKGATWDDVMEQVYIRQVIEAGLKSANENELIEVDEVRRRFGLAV